MKKQKGNFIESMYLYKYVRKSDGKECIYGGIQEVVRGADFAQKRAKKKHETHIEKTLAYPLKNKKKEISHMSLQGYTTFLNKTNRVARDETDDAYHPFVLEFETNKVNEMKDLYNEVLRFINYLYREFNIALEDIVITLNNHKSIYVWLSPLLFGAKPSPRLYKIYTKSYKVMKEDLALKYVDESVVNSSYRLIKTPGSWYKGGYVVNITLQELYDLALGNVTREELTSKQRDIREVNLKNVASFKLSNLYKKCEKEVKKEEKQGTELILTGDKIVNRPCISKVMDLGMVEKGHRNDLLVTLAIGLRDAGFKKKEIEAVLEQKAIEWNHDESLKAVKNKVRTLIKRETNFSCDKAKAIFEDIGMEGVCTSCNNSVAIWLARNVIEDLFLSDASLRHYKLYIELEKQGLLNRKFTLEEANTTERTLNEFAKILGAKVKKDNDELYSIKIKRSKAKCKLPIDFMETTGADLKEGLKQYLYILTKACDGNDKTAYISTGNKKLAKELNYKDERSLINLFKRWESAGLLKFNKQQGLTLFYKTYKVIDINKVKEEREEVNRANKVNQELNKDKQVVNGEQLEFNLKSNKEDNISENTQMVKNVMKEGKRIYNKGSCVTYEIRGRGHPD